MTETISLNGSFDYSFHLALAKVE
ncbi:hypothetical protein SMG44B_40503 [Stenotrophomonas maltophilia]|nr:hypothetical protein BN126380016 [Stenotrophomonas maltophilia]